MRWLPVLAWLGACGGDGASTGAGVSLVLAVPQGVLDPRGFTSVEVVLHQPSGDLVRSASVGADGTFDLGAIDPSPRAWVEATLRNDSGAAVGYGRSTTVEAFSGGEMITVPVRRPIAYFAGTVSRDADGNAQTPALHWTEVPATYADLSVGGNLDGKTQLGSQVVMMIAAGPNLYMVTQATRDPDGALVGAAKISPVSAADHQVGAVLPGAMTGAVIDAAGADDGKTLVIGTATQLFAVDAEAGTARALADGNFARVAILTGEDGKIDALAIRNRGPSTGPCATTAELWWARLSDGAGGGDAMAHRVAGGGFTDVAADRGRAYYVDGCKGELGEVFADRIELRRALAGTGAPAGRSTMLAVSNGQAYVGIETPPATTSLVVASLATNEPRAVGEPRTLWSEAAQQVLRASEFRGVQRQLDATSAVFGHLEIGAGGDYVALTTTAHFQGDPVVDANFPGMTIDTEELRVFDAATGGVVQRYRSWCAGVLDVAFGDIERWACASTTGQTAAASMFDHHINSMTFLFGKK